MLRRLAGWVLFSQARLAFTALSCLAVVAAVVLIAHRSETAISKSRPAGAASPSKRPPQPAAASAPAPAASESHHPTVAARKTAEHFLGLYLRPSDRVPAHVPVMLRKVSTPALWSGLRLADPAALPPGPLRGLQTVTGGAYASEFTAELSSERSLTVDVVAWSHGWRVSDVHPAGVS